MGDRMFASEGDSGYVARLGPAAPADRWDGGSPRRAPGDDAAAGVARRLQDRLDRHIWLLDALQGEQLHPEPPGLGEIFDTARRMYRDTESLLLLCGQEPVGPVPGPRRLSDLLAEAVATAEEPRLVDVRPAPAATVAPAAATELLHVLAELVEHVVAGYPGAHLAVASRIDGSAVVVDVGVDGATRHEPDGVEARRAAVAVEQLAKLSRHGIMLHRPPGGVPPTGSGLVATVRCPPATVTVDEPVAPLRTNGSLNHLTTNGTSQGIGGIGGAAGLGDALSSSLDPGLDRRPRPRPDRAPLDSDPGIPDRVPDHGPDPEYISAYQADYGPDGGFDSRGSGVESGLGGGLGNGIGNGLGNGLGDALGDDLRAGPDLHSDLHGDLHGDLADFGSDIGSGLGSGLGNGRASELPGDLGTGLGNGLGGDASGFGSGLGFESLLDGGHENGSGNGIGAGLAAELGSASTSPGLDATPPSPPSSQSSGVDELFGPLLDLPLEPIDDRYATPIFEAIASAWFREDDAEGNNQGDGRRAGGDPLDWETPQDNEWREAAARAARTEPAPTTSSGLPRRRPGNQLVPPPRTQTDRNGGAPAERVPDRVRDRLSTYQRGLRQGRHRAPGPEGQEPEGW